jgi:hypothetical protein
MHGAESICRGNLCRRGLYMTSAEMIGDEQGGNDAHMGDSYTPWDTAERLKVPFKTVLTSLRPGKLSKIHPTSQPDPR